jgi:hypothetical protein
VNRPKRLSWRSKPCCSSWNQWPSKVLLNRRREQKEECVRLLLNFIFLFIYLFLFSFFIYYILVFNLFSLFVCLTV